MSRKATVWIPYGDILRFTQKSVAYLSAIGHFKAELIEYIDDDNIHHGFAGCCSQG